LLSVLTDDLAGSASHDGPTVEPLLHVPVPTPRFRIHATVASHASSFWRASMARSPSATSASNEVCRSIASIFAPCINSTMASSIATEGAGDDRAVSGDRPIHRAPLISDRHRVHAYRARIWTW